MAALALTISLAGCGVNGSPVRRRSPEPTRASSGGGSDDVVFYGVGASTNPDVGTPGNRSRRPRVRVPSRTLTECLQNV